MNYADAGVSLARADEAMVGVKKSVRTTFNEGVLGDVGNFGGLFTLNHLGMKDPVLVSSVDGVGTKLKVDIEMGTHELPGQDIVNHCCDDILVQGARPLFFLDYVATGRLEPGVMDKLVAGMAKACRENDLVLIGGETAEMPGFYGPGDYDISGTIVGVVERENIIDGKKIKPGTIILGLPSTGLHTNGYSLARKVLFDVAGYKVDTLVDGMDKTIGEALAMPHRSYYPSLIDLCNKKIIQGLAHITGSGYQGHVGSSDDLQAHPAGWLCRKGRNVLHLQHGHGHARVHRPGRQGRSRRSPRSQGREVDADWRSRRRHQAGEVQRLIALLRN